MRCTLHEGPADGDALEIPTSSMHLNVSVLLLEESVIADKPRYAVYEPIPEQPTQYLYARIV